MPITFTFVGYRNEILTLYYINLKMIMLLCIFLNLFKIIVLASFLNISFYFINKLIKFQYRIGSKNGTPFREINQQLRLAKSVVTIDNL